MSSSVPSTAAATNTGDSSSGGGDIPPHDLEGGVRTGPAAVGDSYGWVDEEVLKIRSLFQSVEPLREVEGWLTDNEGLDRMKCFPCSAEDLICHLVPE